MIELSSLSLSSINIVYIIIFIIYFLLIMLTMLFISSYLSAFMMLFIPVLVILLNPDFGIEFLSYKQGEFLSGLLIINNIHILLLIWSALLSIIIYTELLSWYLSRGTLKPKTKKTKNSKPQTKIGSTEANSNDSHANTIKMTLERIGLIKILFRLLEQFQTDFKSLLGKK